MPSAMDLVYEAAPLSGHGSTGGATRTPWRPSPDTTRCQKSRGETEAPRRETQTTVRPEPVADAHDDTSTVFPVPAGAVTRVSARATPVYRTASRRGRRTIPAGGSGTVKAAASSGSATCALWLGSTRDRSAGRILRSAGLTTQPSSQNWQRQGPGRALQINSYYQSTPVKVKTQP